MRSTAIGPSTASAPKRARAPVQNPPPGWRSHAASAVSVIAQEAVVARDRLPPREQQRADRDAAGRQPHDQRPRPPDREEQVADRHEERDRAGRVEQAQLAARARRHVDELVAPHPEHDHATRASARPGSPNATRTPACFQIERDQQVREEAAEVDDEVERLIDACAAGTSCRGRTDRRRAPTRTA